MKFILWTLFLVVSLALLGPVPGAAQDSPNQKLIEAARKEGEIVWYTTMSLDQSKEFMDRFIKKYPFLKPSVFRAGGGALLNRIMSEAKAGKQLFRCRARHRRDCFTTDGSQFGGRLYVAGTKNDRRRLKDKKGFWTAVYVNSVVLGYNKNLVKREDLPRTYDDLLLPKWKGRKICLDDSYSTFLQGLISSWGKDKALAYLKKLAEQEPVIMRGSTVRVQLAAAGEFPLVLAYANIIQYLAEKGAPVDWLPSGAGGDFGEYGDA